MSFCAQMPNSAMRPIVDETLRVSPMTSRATMAPTSVVGTLRMTSRACQTDPNDENRITKMIRITTSISRVSWCRARCWLSNCPPNVT
jgi:hypothetical protein